MKQSPVSSFVQLINEDYFTLLTNEAKKNEQKRDSHCPLSNNGPSSIKTASQNTKTALPDVKETIGDKINHLSKTATIIPSGSTNIQENGDKAKLATGKQISDLGRSVCRRIERQIEENKVSSSTTTSSTRRLHRQLLGVGALSPYHYSLLIPYRL